VLFSRPVDHLISCGAKQPGGDVLDRLFHFHQLPGHFLKNIIDIITNRGPSANEGF